MIQEFINLWNDKKYKDLKNNLIARHLDVLMKTIPPGVERIAPGNKESIISQ